MATPAIDPSARIHPTAIVETGVSIGARTAVWDSVHIRKEATLGHDVIVGEKTYIAYGVRVGNFVKINAMAYLCAGVTVEDGVMISAGVIFANDRFPRAMDKELVGLETSAPTDDTLDVRVRRGATIGAGARIGPGITLGEFSMVAMGAVVTRDVPAHGLVQGNPARLVGFVCACGPRFVRLAEHARASDATRWKCARCSRTYARDGALVRLVEDPHAPSR